MISTKHFRTVKLIMPQIDIFKTELRPKISKFYSQKLRGKRSPIFPAHTWMFWFLIINKLFFFPHFFV